MADYFALLAARLAGAPEAIRPVIPSRFEPLGRADTTPPGQTEAARSRADRRHDFPGEVHEEIPAPPTAPPPSPGSRQPRRDRSERRPAASVPAPGELAPEDFHEPPPVSSDDARIKTPRIPPAAPPRNPEPASPRESDPLRAVRRVTPAGPTNRSAVVAEDSHANPGASEKPASIGEAPRVRAYLVPPVPPPAPVSRTFPAPVVPAEAIPRRGPGDAGRSEMREARLPHSARGMSPPPPSAAPGAGGAPAPIQITIGRIEVQAVMPAAPPPSPAPRRSSTPALTLENYLAGRNGPGTP